MKTINLLKLFVAISATSLLFSGCGSSEDEALEQAMGKDSTIAKSEISSDLINEIIKSIPSPVEMSTLIREVEPKYNASFLNAAGMEGNYTTNFQKAVNIGIYGTDLGYINMYNQKTDAIKYLTSMTNLANDMKIGQFFDFQMIRRLATNSNNLDSLLYITTSNYDKMNTYLQEQNRGNLSLLMLTGGWIEALYIASSVAEKNDSPRLYEKVGEQKIVLDQLKILLDFYKSDPQVAQLSTKLNDLKVVYDSVKIAYEYHPPTIEIVNGVKMVTDNSKSVIQISKADVDQIYNLVSTIRKDLIKE
jgi:hypothetical protein